MRKKDIQNMKKLVAVLLAGVMLAGCSTGGGTASTTAASEAQEQKVHETKASESTGTASGAQSKTLTMAMVSAWDSMIPFDTTSSYSDAVLSLIYDKLIYLKADGTVKPRLADTWEMNTDNTELTFHLNKDAKWHDGQPVTAADVVFTCKLYTAPSMAAARVNNLAPIAGFGEGDESLSVEAVDDYTVKFKLKEATNMDFLLFNKFRDIYILPEHLLKDIPYEKIREDKFWENPVGSGPCVYASQISGERMEFTANKEYHLNIPDWDRFVVRVVPTTNLLSGLINGEIDVLAGNVASLQLSDWDMAKQQANLTCISTESLGYQYMAVNTKKDYLPEKVRQAISMAIDRSLIVDGLLKGEGEEAYGPLAKSHRYYNPNVVVEYNAEQAKALLAEAGWDGSHELIMSVPSGNAIREQAGVIIQQNLLAIGIKVKIETVDFATHMTKLRSGDYDLGLIGSGGSPDPSESVINLKPDHLNNFSQMQDWTLYDTGAKGEYVFDFAERKVIYDEYQDLLKEQVPFCFLYFQNSLFAYNNRVKNVTDSQDFSQLNHDVWNWSISQ